MINKFRQGSAVYKCQCCGKMTRDTGEGEKSCEMCAGCFEVSGYFNSFQDGQITAAEYNKIVEQNMDRHGECSCSDRLEVE
jgi:hypothetical protein